MAFEAVRETEGGGRPIALAIINAHAQTIYQRE
jgi:hypothetical protein